MDAVEKVAVRLGFEVVALPGSAAVSMESTIRFLVSRLVDCGALHPDCAEGVCSRVLKREKIGSTALGCGFAFPHVMSKAVEKVVGVLARSSTPVPWETPDGRGVRTVCLALGSDERVRDYMLALEEIVRAVRMVEASERWSK